MGFDNVRSEVDFVSDDQSWLASSEGTQSMDSITLKLDDARFVEATHFPDGFLTSGIVLAQITASKLWVPYLIGGADDGGRLAVGFLFTPQKVRAGATRVAGSLLWRGEVVEARLPAGSGITAAAKADLAAKFRFV